MKSARLVLVAFFVLSNAAFGELVGDFDDNGFLDVDDINQYAAVIRSGKYDGTFDLDQDGDVNFGDILDWVVFRKNTWLGDFDLNGEFDTGDLVFIFKIGEYEDRIKFNSVYTDGDANGDSEFNAGDLVAIFQNSGSCGPLLRCTRPRPVDEVVVVPEPGSWFVVWLACAVMVCKSRTAPLRTEAVTPSKLDSSDFFRSTAF